MEQYKRDFIEFMYECGVLRFGEFMTKSGRLSPYFINTGNYRTGSQAAKLGVYYAECIMNAGLMGDEKRPVLFGPAYKGIPLVVAASSALYNNYQIDVPYCFNRKEEKDHGEGGSFIGAKLNDGDNVIIIEDVITAGTAVREVIPQLKSAAAVTLTDMIISVDRMEQGTTAGKTAINEVKEEFGITVHPIVTIREIIEHLETKNINGQPIISTETMEKIQLYLQTYCVL